MFPFFQIYLENPLSIYAFSLQEEQSSIFFLKKREVDRRACRHADLIFGVGSLISHEVSEQGERVREMGKHPFHEIAKRGEDRRGREVKRAPFALRVQRVLSLGLERTVHLLRKGVGEMQGRARHIGSEPTRGRVVAPVNKEPDVLLLSVIGLEVEEIGLPRFPMVGACDRWHVRWCVVGDRDLQWI